MGQICTLNPLPNMPKLHKRQCFRLWNSPGIRSPPPYGSSMIRKNQPHPANNKAASGFTVMELMVSLSVIVLLAALLIPAVMQARSTARQLGCKNNSRNLGVALSGYVETHGHFPVLPGRDFPQSSAFLQLLPHLDEAALYDKLKNSKTPGLILRPVTEEIATGRPSVLVCPEDSTAESDPLATCYATNEGWWLREDRGKNLVRDGIMYQASGRRGNQVTPAAIKSGMSNTAAIAEITPGGNTMGRWAIYSTSLTSTHSKNEARNECLASTKVASLDRGRLWSWFFPGSTGYSHIMRPNEKSCNEAFASASWHTGGAQVTMCDGSVRFVSDEIDPDVWMVLGSRLGKL